uniref:Uncharacterized protein n=1 Tax=Cucumis melo TaxID=3656 RepID=A0A9I9EJF4_CUCME
MRRMGLRLGFSSCAVVREGRDFEEGKGNVRKEGKGGIL